MKKIDETNNEQIKADPRRWEERRRWCQQWWVIAKISKNPEVKWHEMP